MVLRFHIFFIFPGTNSASFELTSFGPPAEKQMTPLEFLKCAQDMLPNIRDSTLGPEREDLRGTWQAANMLTIRKRLKGKSN